MIIIYRLDKPGSIFAFHDDYQESDIISKYPGYFFGATKGPYNNINVGEAVPTTGYSSVTLNANLVIDKAAGAQLGIS